MGKPGTGKSTSLANWWDTDNYYKNSKVLVDHQAFWLKIAYSISGGHLLFL